MTYIQTLYECMKYIRSVNLNGRRRGAGDLERSGVFGDLHDDVVWDRGPDVLQGHQAEVGDAGDVLGVPGCSQHHQAGTVEEGGESSQSGT